MKLTGRVDETKEFVEVRDWIKNHVILYTSDVLPKIENAIFKVSKIMDNYTDLDYNEWYSYLHKTMSDWEEAAAITRKLPYKHAKIVAELNQKFDTLHSAMEKLNVMVNPTNTQNSLSSLSPQLSPREPKNDGDSTHVRSSSSAMVMSSSVCKQNNLLKFTLEEKFAKFFARRKNIEITKKAVELTTKELIPTIRNFIERLNDVLVLINQYKTEIDNLIKIPREEERKRHFTDLQKSNARRIKWQCDRFLIETDSARNNLAAIPSEPSDENYVDRWLKEKQKEFDSSEKS